MTTLKIGEARAPIGGEAYLRLLPYCYTRRGIQHINEHEGSPACVYVHPWELDTQQPRINGSTTGRLRHYWGLRGAESKLRRLLRDFEFEALVRASDRRVDVRLFIDSQGPPIDLTLAELIYVCAR
jgi:hypothetical protein